MCGAAANAVAGAGRRNRNPSRNPSPSPERTPRRIRSTPRPNGVVGSTRGLALKYALLPWTERDRSNAGTGVRGLLLARRPMLETGLGPLDRLAGGLRAADEEHSMTRLHSARMCSFAK